MSTTEYPRQDEWDRTAFWTGPVGSRTTFVTGFRTYGGASSTYYALTCTCTPYGGVLGPQISSRDSSDPIAQIEVMARAHALAHVRTEDI